MRKVIGVRFFAVMMTLWSGVLPLRAQEENKPASEDSKAKAERPEKPVHAYRVDFSVNELEAGKKVNSRNYSMNLTSGERNDLKIGTRVPVPVGPSQNTFQYMDVGTSINCMLQDRGDEFALYVHSDFSNFAASGEQHSSQPIVRQININGSTLASPGKLIVIGSVDDPNSNREFQLEATVTRLK
jgi:hypothetical protein